MPTREPELYKDKIEVSLDGRQIFYLFFGGAVIVGLVFVVGVMVGRRVESRGHLDRADTQSTSDPLAALDRLERADRMSFHGALTGGEPTTEVEKTIGEIEKRRAAGKLDRKDPVATGTEARSAKPDARSEAKPDTKNEAKSDAKPEPKNEAKIDAKVELRPEAKADKGERAEVKSGSEPVTRPDGDSARSDKHDGERKAKKHDDGEARADTKSERSETKSGKLESKSDAKPDAKSERSESHADSKRDKVASRADAHPEAKSESKPEGKSDGKDGKDGKDKADKTTEPKQRYTLQLSSFQDRAEAEAFLSSVKSAGFQPYLTEAEVGGKGTFYRIRLGSYRSLDAANDAKSEYEKSAKSSKPAQVMRL